MHDLPILLKAEQGARLLGISRSKFFQLMAAGELPGVVRIGRSVRISRAALERWVREQSGEPADATEAT
ncbi:MAG: helix-turn-helix domain-containing protein [Chloroflexota bacterium]|nr:helix-turn-helix domain-containing protein [Chloroflexota bacterium]